MKNSMIPQIEVIQADDPIEFQTRFNEFLKSVTDSDVDVQMYVNEDYRAIVTYYLSTHEFDRISDEFHAEGLVYLCRNCPYLEDPKDKRVKHCKCKFAELGTTHKDREACEYFYRELKAGRIETIPDYMR